MRKSSNIPYDTENISKHITNSLDDGLKGKKLYFNPYGVCKLSIEFGIC